MFYQAEAGVPKKHRRAFEEQMDSAAGLDQTQRGVAVVNKQKAVELFRPQQDKDSKAIRPYLDRGRRSKRLRIQEEHKVQRVY